MSDIVDKIRAALGHIGSDNRSQWVEAAMAIKSELGDAGFEIWDEWSQASKSYNAKSAKSVWRTANASKISIGTLFWRAQQNGFDLSEFRSDMPVDRAAIEAMAQKQREAREAAEATRLEKQHRAADISAKTLLLAIPAGQDHPYLVRKGLGGDLTPGNLYEIQADTLAKAIGYAPKSDDTPLSGRILVGGVGDLDGVTTLEFIDENGLKSALAGGRKSAAWWAALPLIDNPDQVIVCEGMATAASIAAAEQSSGRNSVVVAALSDTNMPNVAEVMRERYPSSRMVIASDLGNGEKKAQEAAEKTGAFYVVPVFPDGANINGSSPTDFNDLHQISGLSDVAAFTLNGKRLGESSNAIAEPSEIAIHDQVSIETASRRMDRFVTEFEQGTLKDSDTQILGETPTILQYLGAQNLPLQIDGATVRKVLAEKHRYFVTAAMLRDVTGHLYDPLAVFNSPDKNGAPGKIVLTDLADPVTGQPVVVAVHIEKRAGRYLVNDIASIYEASTATQRKKFTAETLEYYRNEKSLEQATTERLDISLPSVVQSAQDSGVKIATETMVVKHYQPKKGDPRLEHSAESNSRQDQGSDQQGLAASTTPNLRKLDGMVQKAEGSGNIVSTGTATVNDHQPSTLTSSLTVKPRMNHSPASAKDETRRDFRQELTDTLIERLKTGTAPWQKPWVGAPETPPYNPVTGKAYRGANHLWLSMAGFSDPRFATYRQAAAEGWQVRKGEKGLPIEYWKAHAQRTMLDKDGKPVLDENGKPQQQTVKLDRPAGPFHATVFNLSQMDNVPPLPDAPVKFEWDPVVAAESLLKGHQATIVHDQADGAFYRPGTDSIHLPPVDQFPTAADYYGTALHELAHWTGHESRLNRDLTGTFGSASYAREELRAELSSYLMAAEYGIPHNVERHASYVESWIGALSNDKNEIFKASREADSMIDYITAPLRNKEIAQDQTAPPPPEPIELPAPVPPPSTRPEAVATRSAGGVLYPVDSIPTQIKGAAKEHFGARVADYVPRENGGPYKGEVFVAGDYYAQAVSNKSVVYHRKDRVAFPEAFGDPNGKEVSIRYKDGNGQGVSFDPARDQLDRAVTTLTRAAQRLGFDGFDLQINKAKNAVWDNIQSRRNPATQDKAAQPTRSR